MKKLKLSQYKNYFLLAGGALAIYLVLPWIKSLLGIGNYVSSFFTGKEANVKMEEEIKKAQGKAKESKGEQYWKLIADAIWTELGTFSWFEDQDKVVGYLCQVHNDADFLLLVKTFGVREEKTFGIGFQGGKNLHTIINEDLSKANIKKVNTYYETKGIQYRF